MLAQKQPPEVFCKKGVLKNFVKFTGKHLSQGLFFNKVADLTTASFNCELCDPDFYMKKMTNFQNKLFNIVVVIESLQIMQTPDADTAFKRG